MTENRVTDWQAVAKPHDLGDGTDVRWAVTGSAKDIEGAHMTISIADWLDEKTARLISASPDLRDALREVTDAYWGVDDDHAGDGGEPPACIVRARAALAKANPTQEA